jgi:hypothetical protein
MKVPGRAWLQFQAEPLEADRTRLSQTAYFAPRGLFGILYWYALYPIHGFMFSRLIRTIAQGAASSSSAHRAVNEQGAPEAG